MENYVQALARIALNCEFCYKTGRQDRQCQWIKSGKANEFLEARRTYCGFLGRAEIVKTGTDEMCDCANWPKPDRKRLEGEGACHGAKIAIGQNFLIN